MSGPERPAHASTDPVVVAAFEGWNDAGDAATGAIEHLELIWDATPLAALDPEDYYDFQVNRPTVSLVDGVSRADRVADHADLGAAPPGSERDVVLIRGIEPNMRWRGFCEELIELCRRARRADVDHPRGAARRHPAHPARAR